MVSPNSRLHFRLLDQSTFRKDTVIGQKTVNLVHVLKGYHGKLENLELTLDVAPDKSYLPVSVGKLIIFLSDLNINVHSATEPLQPRPGPVPSEFSCRPSIIPERSFSKFLGVLIYIFSPRNLRIRCLRSHPT